jgi:hypothetical protein
MTSGTCREMSDTQVDQDAAVNHAMPAKLSSPRQSSPSP